MPVRRRKLRRKLKVTTISGGKRKRIVKYVPPSVGQKMVVCPGSSSELFPLSTQEASNSTDHHSMVTTSAIGMIICTLVINGQLI